MIFILVILRGIMNLHRMSYPILLYVRIPLEWLGAFSCIMVGDVEPALPDGADGGCAGYDDEFDVNHDGWYD